MIFSGVCAHGQNGFSEITIQTVVNLARHMMLRQDLLLPDNFDIQLLFFALQHAVYLWNRLLNGIG